MDEFIISDLHLNHANIIKYCNRNFANVTKMNETICRRWNRVVGEDDLIYYLGDFCHRNPKEWLKRLNGTVIFIRGNHDNALKKDNIHPLLNRHIYNFKGENILMIHNPNEVNIDRSSWLGWIIHGHTHNNQLGHYPHISNERKTINVSAELLNYTPIKIKELLEKRKITG
jgi:calcineurin-like phosphoesterase family protein